jgi:glutathione S-transferase
MSFAHEFDENNSFLSSLADPYCPASGGLLMFELYFSPGAVSLAAHIALEEAGVPYRETLVSIPEAQNLTPEYRRVHPLGRVPALRVLSGEVLTETPAILRYVSRLAPGRELLPESDAWAAARADEWLSIFASSVHTTFMGFRRPGRFTDNASACEALAQDGLGRFAAMLAFVESRLPETGYLLGKSYSLCDAYAAVFLFWGGVFELPLAPLPRYRALAGRVLERPAAQRAIEREQLTQRVAKVLGGPTS